VPERIGVRSSALATLTNRSSLKNEAVRSLKNEAVRKEAELGQQRVAVSASTSSPDTAPTIPSRWVCWMSALTFQHVKSSR
jgi:hypothetical protein